jgi:hypothetical protein
MKNKLPTTFFIGLTPKGRDFLAENNYISKKSHQRGCINIWTNALGEKLLEKVQYRIYDDKSRNSYIFTGLTKDGHFVTAISWMAEECEAFKGSM